MLSAEGCDGGSTRRARMVGLVACLSAHTSAGRGGTRRSLALNARSHIPDTCTHVGFASASPGGPSGA